MNTTLEQNNLTQQTQPIPACPPKNEAHAASQNGPAKAPRRGACSAPKGAPGQKRKGSRFKQLLELTQALLKARRWHTQKMLCLSNVATGTHTGALTRVAQAILAAAPVFVKKAERGVVVCDTQGEPPLGVVQQSTREAGQLVAVALLGSADQTRRVLSADQIKEGDFLICNKEGQAMKLPEEPAGAYVVGRALTDAAPGTCVEFDPCLPYAVGG